MMSLPAEILHSCRHLLLLEGFLIQEKPIALLGKAGARQSVAARVYAVFYRCDRTCSPQCDVSALGAGKWQACNTSTPPVI